MLLGSGDAICLCFPRRTSDGLSILISNCACCSSSIVGIVPGARGVYVGGGSGVGSFTASSGVSGMSYLCTVNNAGPNVGAFLLLLCPILCQTPSYSATAVVAPLIVP